MTVTTIDRDGPWRKALVEIRKIRSGGPEVAIGFQGSTGNAPHKNGKGASVADIATFNEFGTRTIPQRSFMVSTMDENRRQLLRMNRNLYFKIAAGTMTTERALEIMGIRIKSLIQKKITDLRDPPNAPSTIRRKRKRSTNRRIGVEGGDSGVNPLIDTGQMRQSVSYKVRMRRLGGLV